MSGLKIPPRSPALQSLWRRLWLSSDQPASRSGNRQDEADIDSRSSGTSGAHHDALSLEALYRSGLVGDVVQIAGQRASSSNPLLATLHARALIGLGRRRAACDIAKRSIQRNAAMPKRIKGQALLVMGYCAAASNNAAAAGLAADLAREENVKSPLGLAVMDSIASGTKPRLDVPDRMSLLDLRFLQLASSADLSRVLDTAEPAVFGALASDTKTKPDLRLAAAERAAALHAVSAETLGEVYRAQRFNRADIADPLPTKSSPAKRRALLFQAIRQARDPAAQAQFILAFFKLAKRDGLHFTTAKLVLEPLRQLHSDNLAWFSETAAEIAVTGGDYELARRWAAARGQDRLGHWMALIDIADPQSNGDRGADLQALNDLARQRRFKSENLHRLATVLDALEYNVPIPLWEAASASPQPTKGYLPETGFLPRLAKAAANREVGHTVLLAIRTIGSRGATGAHMIALGDTIRALRKAGLEPAARRLAFESLIDAWPRNSRTR